MILASSKPMPCFSRFARSFSLSRFELQWHRFFVDVAASFFFIYTICIYLKPCPPFLGLSILFSGHIREETQNNLKESPGTFLASIFIASLNAEKLLQ